MMSSMEFLSRTHWPRYAVRGRPWPHWPERLRSPLWLPALGEACLRVGKRVAGAADRVAVQVMRLAVLAVLVWGGSAMVRNVTVALQQVAGHSPAVRAQAGMLR